MTTDLIGSVDTEQRSRLQFIENGYLDGFLHARSILGRKRLTACNNCLIENTFVFTKTLRRTACSQNVHGLTIPILLYCLLYINNALLCLPPGDFAVLLKAGMSVKQAIVYNLLSALMAYVGMVIGTAVGQYTHNVTSWIFAVTAGMFLYVALVDMVSVDNLSLSVMLIIT